MMHFNNTSDISFAKAKQNTQVNEKLSKNKRLCCCVGQYRKKYKYSMIIHFSNEFFNEYA